MKPAKIIGWYSSFSILIFILYWTMPNSWRNLHPHLAKVVSLDQYDGPYAAEGEIFLFGDCLAFQCPWPFVRAGYPRCSFTDLYKLLQDDSQLQEEISRSKRVVVIGGINDLRESVTKDTLNYRIARMQEKLHEINPQIQIIVIPPELIHSIAKIEGAGDGWHLNRYGYNILLSYFPALAAAASGIRSGHCGRRAAERTADQISLPLENCNSRTAQVGSER